MLAGAIGEVTSFSKISDTVGNFTGTLDSTDHFGTSVTNLGDLDGDGIADLAVGAQYDDDGGGARGAIYVLLLNADGTVKSHQKISDTAGGFTASIVDGDRFGSSLTNLGDLNGDGITDLAVGARWDDDGGGVYSNRGAVYILFLNSDGTVKSHQKISDTAGGFTATLYEDGDFGQSVTSLGDLDGDGINDLVVGADDDDDGGNERGAVFVLLLNANGTVKSHQKISDTSGGFTTTLDNYDHFGGSLANLGDLDGDGIPDLVVGAHGDDDGGSFRGALYILLLNLDGTVKSHQKISDTAGGLTMGLDSGDQFGIAVTNLGDLDGDGVTDLSVGAFGDDDGGTSRGAVYVLFLNVDGKVKSRQKISDTEGNFTAALDDIDTFGGSLANLGDLDGDGLVELSVGVPRDDDGGYHAVSDPGAVYILSLEQVTPPGVVTSFSKISDTEGNFTAVFEDSDKFGKSLTNLGDLDGDGIADLAVGQYLDDDGGLDRGAAYVLFLNLDGTVKSHQKISDTAGNFTATLDNYDRFGSSLTNLGDLDGDGIAELAVGSRKDDDGGYDRGAVYVLFLNTDGTVKSHQKISDTAGNFTATLDNHDYFGNSLASLGDLDGDGISELAVGTYGDDDGGDNHGAVYVLFLNSDGMVKSHRKISDTTGNLTATLNDGDHWGSSLTNLGDLDKDGITDLAVGAAFDDDGNPTILTNRGAIYVLFLNADGTVKSHQKISDTEGNFTANLEDGDKFGSSTTKIGDLDGDGIADLGVGAIGDDDGGSSHGAVYLLFLNADGTVKSYRKISDTKGNFTATLESFDFFGDSLANLGDLDGDGVTELAVGARNDDDGGVLRGAVYILSLAGVRTVKIIDDGDPGFAIESGAWGTGTAGAEGDNRNASRFNGSKVASWTFDGLLPGVYRVSATWAPSPVRATDAPFTVFDGVNPLATVDVNQQLAPSGEPGVKDLGVPWQDLGNDLFHITGNTLTVELSNDANGYVMADAVRIERIGELPPPPMIVDDGDPGFAIESGSWGSGNAGAGGDNRNASIFGGTKVARWSFTNLTPGVYRVSTTWVPSAARATDAPFTLFNGFTPITTVDVNQQLTPSGSPDLNDLGVPWQDLVGNFQVTGDTLFVKLTNIANGYVMADAIRIERVADLPQVIDDGDAGFAIESGTWGTGNAGAFGDNRNASIFNGNKVASWTFTGLTAGTYRVSATWAASLSRATDAPYTIFDGATSLTTIDANQQQAPDDFTEGGIHWEDLTTVLITGDTLVVQLSNDANNYVMADAIRIQQVNTVKPKITIDGNFNDWDAVTNYADPVDDQHDTDHDTAGATPAYVDHPDVDLLNYTVTHDNENFYFYFESRGEIGRTQMENVAQGLRAGRYYVIVTIDVDDDDATGYPLYEGGYYTGTTDTTGYDMNGEIEFYNGAFNTGHYLQHGAQNEAELIQAFADQSNGGYVYPGPETQGPFMPGFVNVLPGTYDFYTQWVYKENDPGFGGNDSVTFVQDRGPVVNGIIDYALSPDGHQLEMKVPFKGFLVDSNGDPIVATGKTVDLSFSLEASGELSNEVSAQNPNGIWASDTAEPITGYVITPVN